jgi:hypothetical protein
VDSHALLDWAPLTISIVALLVSFGAAALPFWRRPSLSLSNDRERTHSRVEGDEIPYLRLLVHNAKRKRSAMHARVVLDGYRHTDSDATLTRVGSPFLSWPSTFGQDSDSYVSVIFSDASRPVGLGRFVQIGTTWHFFLELAGNLELTDNRDWLPPGAWTVRLIVGADDGDAHAYEVDLAWAGNERDPRAVLNAALDSLQVRPAGR